MDVVKKVNEKYLKQIPGLNLLLIKKNAINLSLF